MPLSKRTYLYAASFYTSWHRRVCHLDPDKIADSLPLFSASRFFLRARRSEWPFQLVQQKSQSKE